ncbi:unnamed protein product, partial [marine sediment metagenome]
ESYGNFAIEEGRYTLYAEGDQIADQGKYIVTWKKEDGQWKLHRDIWNTSNPAPMSSKNEKIVRQFMLEHFKNPTIIYEMCTDDLIVHWAWGDSTYPASEVFRILSPPTDPRLEIDDCFASGNKVGMRFRVLFDHPSGNQVIRDELLIFRMEGDRVAEAWAYFDRRYEQEQRDELDALVSKR